MIKDSFDNNNNSVNDNYKYTQYETKGARGYSKIQFSMLSKALLVASVGLIFTCILGFVIAYVYGTTNILETGYGYNLLTSLSTIFLIISLISTFVWMFKLQTASMTLAFGTIALYCIANGIGFGSLFYLLNVQQILIIFGTIGGIFFITWFFSTVVSVKFMMSFTKFLIIAFFAFLIFNLVIFLFNFFNIFGMRPASGFQWTYIVSSLISGLLSIGFLAYNMWKIQMMDKFLDSTPELKNKYGIFFGFQILMNLITLIWILARVILFSSRN